MQYRQLMFTGPWQVELQNADKDLEALAPDQVLIRTHYSLISPGTELACLSGREPWFDMPRTPGYVSVGEVVASGEAVEGCAPGDEVFQYGAHAEYTVADAGGLLVRVPEGIDPKLVPFTRIATIAMTALRVSDIELGDEVAVVGLGLVGNVAAQLARLQGGRVIGIEPNEARLATARACGLTRWVQAVAGAAREPVMELTGDGVATLIEATGIPQAAAEAIKLVARRGEMILLGSPRGEMQTNLTDFLNYVHIASRSSVTLKGAHEWRYRVLHDPFGKHSIERNTHIAFELIRTGVLAIEPLITHVLSPERATEAYFGLRDEPDRYLGVLFDWT